MKTTYLAGVILTLVGRVAAWGAVGHETVGYIAMEFLGEKTAAFVKKTISDTYDNNLGPAAPWADSVRYLSEFTFSAPFHYIDANGELFYSFLSPLLTFNGPDDPKGGSCSVQESRDCGDTGCLCKNHSHRKIEICLLIPINSHGNCQLHTTGE